MHRGLWAVPRGVLDAVVKKRIYTPAGNRLKFSGLLTSRTVIALIELRDVFTRFLASCSKGTGFSILRIDVGTLSNFVATLDSIRQAVNKLASNLSFVR
jgi:hypothetical protein